MFLFDFLNLAPYLVLFSLICFGLTFVSCCFESWSHVLLYIFVWFVFIA